MEHKKIFDGKYSMTVCHESGLYEWDKETNRYYQYDSEDHRKRIPKKDFYFILNQLKEGLHDTFTIIP